MSYYDPYGMVQPGFVPGGPGDPSMGGAGYYGGMPGLLGPQGSAVNLGLLYRPWEPSYQETYGPSGMYGFSWPTLPNYSSGTGSSGGRSWMPDWDDVNPPEPEPEPENPIDPNDTRNPENRGGKMAGADSMLSAPVDLLDYYSDSVAGIGMDLDMNTSINANTMGLNPQVTRDLWGRTLPGYTTPGVTTSAVSTALPAEPEVIAEEISVTDITNDFSGGGTGGNDMGGWGGGPGGGTSGGSSGVGPGGVGGGVGKSY